MTFSNKKPTVELLYDASELGWPPGMWPQNFFYTYVGNTVNMIRAHAVRNAENEVIFFVYKSHETANPPLMMKVCND